MGKASEIPATGERQTSALPPRGPGTVGRSDPGVWEKTLLEAASGHTVGENVAAVTDGPRANCAPPAGWTDEISNVGMGRGLQQGPGHSLLAGKPSQLRGQLGVENWPRWRVQRCNQRDTGRHRRDRYRGRSPPAQRPFQAAAWLCPAAQTPETLPHHGGRLLPACPPPPAVGTGSRSRPRAALRTGAGPRPTGRPGGRRGGVGGAAFLWQRAQAAPGTCSPPCRWGPGSTYRRLHVPSRFFLLVLPPGPAPPPRRAGPGSTVIGAGGLRPAVPYATGNKAPYPSSGPPRSLRPGPARSGPARRRAEPLRRPSGARPGPPPSCPFSPAIACSPARTRPASLPSLRMRAPRKPLPPF